MQALWPVTLRGGRRYFKKNRDLVVRSAAKVLLVGRKTASHCIINCCWSSISNCRRAELLGTPTWFGCHDSCHIFWRIFGVRPMPMSCHVMSISNSPSQCSCHERGGLRQFAFERARQHTSRRLTFPHLRRGWLMKPAIVI